jgi:hypothetical protein
VGGTLAVPSDGGALASPADAGALAGALSGTSPTCETGWAEQAPTMSARPASDVASLAASPLTRRRELGMQHPSSFACRSAAAASW